MAIIRNTNRLMIPSIRCVCIYLFFVTTISAVYGQPAPYRPAEKADSDPIERDPPVNVFGKLYVCGTYLCDQNHEPVQLRGMSTHGLQWYGWNNCVTPESLDALYNDWGADIVRISLYVQEGGYASNPEGFTTEVNTIIEEVTKRGMYAIIDWHQLSPGDPMENLENAKTFFTNIAAMHHQKTNILYEIANEPNDVSWSRIVEYADSIIPVIRRYDEDAVILVGTPGWSSLGISQGNGPKEIYENQITVDDNIMYAFHFYAASHGQNYRNALEWAAQRLPIFVSEFGTQTYTGDGDNDFVSTQAYFNILDTYKIGWTNWNYSHDFRSGAVWKVGTCPSGPWTEDNLKEAGRWIRENMRSRLISFNENEPDGRQNSYALQQNFPNPFNSVTTIQYSISESEMVMLDVYNVLGQKVQTLVRDTQTPGTYREVFDASRLTSGVYLYRIRSGEYTEVKKMIFAQ
jgi:endoglucanase